MSARRRATVRLLALSTTLAAAAVTVVATGPTTSVGARPPLTATVAADRHATARPAPATPAPTVTAVAGAADPTALYVLDATTAEGAGPVHVVRTSRPGQVLAVGVPLPAGADLVRAGDSLWVAGGAMPAVYRLDPASLGLLQRLDLPVSALAVAATAGVLWVGGPGRLVRVDPRTGAVTAALPVDGDVTALSADPAGRRLYAAATTGRGSTVSERDARTGALVAAHRLAPGAAHLAASAAGVWVWQEGATPPAMLRLRSGDLRQVAAVAPMLGRGPLRGALAGSMLWVADPTSISCADPLTGRVRATWASPPAERILAAEPSRVAVLSAGRLLLLPADSRCR